MKQEKVIIEPRKTIPFVEWERKEHYEFFHTIDVPFYSFTANIDITQFLTYIHEQDIPFYYGFIYAVMEVINSQEDYKVRKHGDQMIWYDKLEPSFTDLAPGSRLHKICKCPIEGTMKEYALRARELAKTQTVYFPTAEEEGRDDYVYITSLPWLSYTAATNTVTFQKDDFIPRISWGKYFNENGKVLIPFTLNANHCAIDGLQVGELFEGIQNYCDRLY